MKLNLKEVFDIPGESLDFSYEMPMADYELFGVHPFTAPVKIEGRAFNEAGIPRLVYTAAFVLEVPCDRCLEPFSKEYRLSFDEILTLKESEEQEEYIPAPNGELDMDELCISDILLSLPTKQLCREDCKGLCPTCGVNLNRFVCNCSKSEVDPRLSALGKLLQ